jgi:CRISPR-associated protein Csd2
MATSQSRFVPSELQRLYEVHSFRHAAEVLATGCREEYEELLDALRRFRITTQDILEPGGNESAIPKQVSALLRPKGWLETRIKGDLLVTLEVKDESKSKPVTRTIAKSIAAFLDGHKVDYVKNQVAFDLEWNSKDQTFDRDLYAFRAFHECGVISAAVLLTRSESLNSVFKQLKVMPKYGASTTWMGKLLYRLNANRNGGCPVLVFGITPELISDWKPQ